MVAQMPPIRCYAYIWADGVYLGAGVGQESFVSFYDFPVEHWVHLRTTNPLVQAKFQKALNSEARRQLREMSYAPTRVECERLRDKYVSDLRADGRSDAADTVLRDWSRS